jgi:P27 family predicted phage terminase small subunit
VKPDCPPMPKGLSRTARKEWNRIVPELEALGILGVIDGVALAAYCQNYARWIAAEAEIENRGILITTPNGDLKRNPAVGIAADAMKLMKSFLIEFGMTPSSRSRVKICEKRKDDSQWDEFERDFPPRECSVETNDAQ